VTSRNGSNGHHVPIDADRQRWLENLIAACKRVAANVPDSTDPYLGTLLTDVEALRLRLAAELDAQ
jgi:hypothetical protein